MHRVCTLNILKNTNTNLYKRKESESTKFIIEFKPLGPMTWDLSKNSLRKLDFNSRIVVSLSLNIWLFLSLNIVHIKQRVAPFRAEELLCLLNQLHHPNTTLITLFDITHHIPNLVKTRAHRPQLNSYCTMN